MSHRPKRALITGITGQDGAYLASYLHGMGYDVIGGSPRRAAPNLWRLEEVGLINPETGQPVDRFRLISLDVTCSAQVNDILFEEAIDEVYNLAAQSFVPESFSSPIATFKINAVGVLNFLDAIRRHSNLTRFYQAGTSEMFGLVNVEAQDEETPFHPRSPYAVAKAAAYYSVQNYREAYGLHASTGILFNHESPLRGEEFVTRKVTKGVAEIVANKREYISLGNMDAYRDWGHAADYVKAMHAMLQQDSPDDYVIATGVKHNVRDLVDLAFARVGISDWTPFVKLDERFRRPSDVPLLCGNPAKAKEKLGWQPSFDFETMIHQMVDYDLEREGVDAVKFHLEHAS